MDCVFNEKLPDFALNILFHVVILFVFLSLFFIFYISKVEKSSMENELSDNIQKTLKNTNISGINAINPQIIQKLKEKYKSPDPVVTTYNHWLFRTVLIVVVYTIITIILITWIMKSYYPEMNIKDVIIENMITFIFVGLVEYLFFTKVAIKYIPVEPSTIKNTTLKTLVSLN